MQPGKLFVQSSAQYVDTRDRVGLLCPTDRVLGLVISPHHVNFGLVPFGALAGLFIRQCCRRLYFLSLRSEDCSEFTEPLFFVYAEESLALLYSLPPNWVPAASSWLHQMPFGILVNFSKN